MSDVKSLQCHVNGKGEQSQQNDSIVGWCASKCFSPSEPISALLNGTSQVFAHPSFLAADLIRVI